MSDVRHSFVESSWQLCQSLADTALGAACAATAMPRPRFRAIDQSGANAFVTDPSGLGPTITATTGMLKCLDERGLAVVFVNLLSRLEAGIGRRASAERDDSEVRGYANLPRANAVADAYTLLRLRDPAQVLDAMYRMALCDNRVGLTLALPPACFFTWPYPEPPHDLEDRIRDVVSLAGPEGQTWWQELHSSRGGRADGGRRTARISTCSPVPQRRDSTLVKVLRARLAPARGQGSP